MKAKKPPPPGSSKAIKAGCVCPVMDNDSGRGYMGNRGIYVIRGGCPIHGTQEKKA